MKKDNLIRTRAISWDGVTMVVPHNWELALYRYRRRYLRVELEDEYSVRLEAEWSRTRRAGDSAETKKRYDGQTRALARRAEAQEELTELGPGWLATIYTLPGEKRQSPATPQRLATAIYQEPALFACFIFHFAPEDQEAPAALLQTFAAGLVHHAGTMVPWQLYDIAVELPRQFALESTMIDIGVKLLVFRWRSRRFHLWHFSLADKILTGEQSLEAWVTGYLNSYGRVKGVVFGPGADGEITCRRRRPHFFGHRDQLSRWCFRYRGHCFVDRERNQVIAWVYSYRGPADLAMIPPALTQLPG